MCRDRRATTIRHRCRPASIRRPTASSTSPPPAIRYSRAWPPRSALPPPRSVRDFASAKLRSQNRVALNEVIAVHTRRFTSAVLIDLLAKAGVPCGPIYKLDQVFGDEQVRHLGMAVPVPNPGGGEMTLVGPAIKLSRTPARMKRTVGEAGENKDENPRDLRYRHPHIPPLRRAHRILPKLNNP